MKYIEVEKEYWDKKKQERRDPIMDVDGSKINGNYVNPFEWFSIFACIFWNDLVKYSPKNKYYHSNVFRREEKENQGQSRSRDLEKLVKIAGAFFPPIHTTTIYYYYKCTNWMISQKWSICFGCHWRTRLLIQRLTASNKKKTPIQLYVSNVSEYYSEPRTENELNGMGNRIYRIFVCN